MALVIPPGFAEVSIPLKHSAVTRAAAITFGVDVTALGGVTPSTCNDIGGSFNANFAGALANEVTIGPVRMSVGQDGGENLAVVGTQTFAGTSATEKVASNCAVIFTKATARGGRRGRGRFYLPWAVNDADCSEVGIIAAGVVSSFSGNGAAFLTSLAAAPDPTPMVLLHDTGNTPTGGPNVVTSLNAQALIGSQRRRLGRK